MSENVASPSRPRHKGKYAAKSNRRRRQKKSPVILYLLLAVCSLALVAALVFLFTADPLRGQWRVDEVTAYRFDGSGNGALILPDREFAFSYETDGEVLSIDFVSEDARDYEYRFEIQGDQLTLMSSTDRETVTHTLTRE